jgi:TRAP-type mannitol/chloroaromatic compound transport system substrate-binding protein
MAEAKRATSRRRLLAGASAAAGAAALAAPAVSRAETVALRMQSSWPEHDILHEMAQEYGTRVRRMAGRRLAVDLRPAGAVVPGTRVHDACHAGVLDGAHTVTVMLSRYHPAADLFGNGPPFGGDGHVMLAWLHRGGGRELYHELLHDVLGLDLVSFFAMPMPTQPLGWFKEPARRPEDLIGLRYRTTGLAVQMKRAMGVIIGRMWPYEARDAMARGTLDAFEMNNPTMDRRFGAHEVARHYMMGSFHQPAEMFEIVFNRSWLEALPDELQAILDYGAEAASTSNLSTALDAYPRDLQALVEEHAVELHRTPDSILRRQLEAWDAVVAELEQDPFSAKVIASQKAWCERVGFYRAMNDVDHGIAYRHNFPGRLEEA